jgi:PhnB protein
MGGSRGPKSLGGTAGSIHLYVADVDAFFQRALDAGATVEMPLENQFWGDRYGKLTDPFGHTWGIASHIEDVTEEEQRRRVEAFSTAQAT